MNNLIPILILILAAVSGCNGTPEPPRSAKPVQTSKSTAGWVPNEDIRKRAKQLDVKNLKHVVIRFWADDDWLSPLKISDRKSLAEIHRAFATSERRDGIGIEPTVISEIGHRVTLVDKAGKEVMFNVNNLDDANYWGKTVFDMMAKFRAKVRKRR